MAVKKIEDKALSELSSENALLKDQVAELTKLLEECMERLTEKESTKGTHLTAVIKTKEGKLTFHGNGINVAGEVLTGRDFQNKPELALELYKKGCESFTK